MLGRYGFTGTMSQWNERVESFTRSWRERHGGADPTPDLVFDVARSPVTVQDFPRLIAVPTSAEAARTRAALPAGYDPFSSYLTELSEAVRKGAGPRFLAENRAFLDTLSPSRKRIAIDLALQASDEESDWQDAHPQYVSRFKAQQRRIVEDMLRGRIDEGKATRTLLDLDLRQSFRRFGLQAPIPKAAGEKIDWAKQGVSEIFWGLIHAPYAISAIAQGYGKDWLDTWGRWRRGRSRSGFRSRRMRPSSTPAPAR